MIMNLFKNTLQMKAIKIRYKLRKGREKTKKKNIIHR